MRNKLITPLLDGLNQNKMNSKKLYRIELFESNAILQELVIMACLSNGGKYLSLTDLESIAKGNYVRYSAMGEGITISLIGNTLLIDKGTVCQLKLEEIEVLEMDCPTLSAYEAKEILTGIADETNQELLN